MTTTRISHLIKASIAAARDYARILSTGSPAEIEAARIMSKTARASAQAALQANIAKLSAETSEPVSDYHFARTMRACLP